VLSYLRSFDRRGLVAGLLVVVLLAGGIVVGSRNLKDYDPILLTYTLGILFSASAVVYRYAIWLQRPPTAVLFRRCFRLLLKRGERLQSIAFLVRATFENLVAQRFIRRRGVRRWVMHFCIAWGSLLAALVTFPLVFGWLHFETRRDDPEIYRVVMLGLGVGEFDARSWLGDVTFNLLNISAVMVITGVSIALNKRLKDMQNISRQQFGDDIVPLILLLAISLTGLMLTFSMHALGGASYSVLSLVHAVVVTVTLLYIPFGKFFHIFQRPAQIGVLLYKKKNAEQAPACCRLCGEGFAAVMQIEDLKEVMIRQGFDWSMGSGPNYLEICPACRRRAIGVVQGRRIAGAHGAR